MTEKKHSPQNPANPKIIDTGDKALDGTPIGKKSVRIDKPEKLPKPGSPTGSATLDGTPTGLTAIDPETGTIKPL